MPTKYPPTTNYKAMEWAATGDEISKFIEENVTAFMQLARGTSAEFHQDDLEPVMVELRLCYMWFLAECSARPLRSLNKIKSTLQRIETSLSTSLRTARPLIRTVDYFYVAFARASAEQQSQLRSFTIGAGVLEVESVGEAARAAIQEIDCQLAERPRGGRTKDHLAQSLASGAKTLFQTMGGKVTGTRGGPFFQFLELLRKPVLERALRAGSSLSLEPLFQLARASHR